MKNQKEELKRNNTLSENFRDFLVSAKIGGEGSRYEWGQNPEEKQVRMDSVKEMLSYIADMSNTALNVIENNQLSDDDLDKMTYVKRQVDKSRKSVVEAYLKIQDAVQGKH